MLIAGKIIDDLKTERKNISPPLPIYLRLVPILFYLSILMGILLNGLFAVQFMDATRTKDIATQQLAAAQSNLKKLNEDRRALEQEVKRASDVAAWVESARPLQPLIVNIARSIGPEFTIVELRLDRDSENPTQLKLGLRLNGDSTKQLDLTLERIAADQYRTYTPQQTVSRGEIEYKATLVWQPGSNTAPTESEITP